MHYIGEAVRSSRNIDDALIVMPAALDFPGSNFSVRFMAHSEVQLSGLLMKRLKLFCKHFIIRIYGGFFCR